MSYSTFLSPSLFVSSLCMFKFTHSLHVYKIKEFKLILVDDRTNVTLPSFTVESVNSRRECSVLSPKILERVTRFRTSHGQDSREKADVLIDALRVFSNEIYPDEVPKTDWMLRFL